MHQARIKYKQNICLHHFYFLILLFAFLTIPFSTFAQQKVEFETNNIRIDPKWIKSNVAGDFIWAYDIKTDAVGNVYSTGYFKKYLQSGDSAINPNCQEYGDCGDIYFLMKHDNNGKLLWTRYAIGNSRPCKLAIDRKGYIIVVGNVFSRKLIFTTNNSFLVELDKPKDYNSGIFICKYDSEGSLIKTKFYSEGKQEFANDFFIDKKENICIGGNYIYYNHNDRGSQKRSYLLLKLNKNWESVWKKQGDTTGLSHISAVYMDNNKNILASGAYTNAMDLDGKKLVSNDYNQLAFLVKYNENGKLKWVIDSISQYRFGSGQTMVCDKKGNTYVGISTSYSFMFFTKVDKEGKIKWSVTTNGRSSNSPQKLVIDKKDNIYMCGEGYGAILGSTGTDTFSYISKGSIDFFIAKYNSEGKLLWLKAGGDKGTDYCKAISIYKNDLFAFGWFGVSLRFKDSVLKSHSGYNFWLAKFDIKKLEYIDKQAPFKISRTEHLAEKPTINHKNCSCHQKIEEKNIYLSPISLFVPYSNFREFCKWDFLQSETDYKNLFYKALTFNVGHDETFYQFSAISFDPIKLIHPDKTITINLTPCTTDTNFFELPVTLSYRYGIKKSIYDFDYKTFDHSAKSYLEIIMKTYGVGEEAVIKEALNSKIYTESEDYYEINAFLRSVNKKYKTNFKSWKPEDTAPELKIERFIKELKRNKINLFNFILNEFVLTEQKPHKVNALEASNIEYLLYKKIGNFSLINFDRTIYPGVNATFGIKNIGFEISENILRRWDTIAKKPVTDLNGKYIPANIVTDVSELFYSNFDGLSAKINDVCVERTEITGTGILVDFNKAELIAHASKEKKPYNFQYNNYPLFITDTILAKNQPYSTTYYDTFLTKFSGLLVQDAFLKIPFNNQTISAKGLNIIINNKLISGKIFIELFTQENLNNKHEIRIKANNIIISTSLEEFEIYLKSIGLNISNIDRTATYITKKETDSTGKQYELKIKEKEFILFDFKRTVL